MKVVVTNEAKADLLDIGEFIRTHNPSRAITFVNELLDRCTALADMPRAYPLVPRYESRYQALRASELPDFLSCY
jgi:toxin ParE1/3/4